MRRGDTVHYILIDFDGTMVDVMERYYRIFQKWWNITNLDIYKFSFLKRNLWSDKEILKSFSINFSIEDYESYKSYKIERLEDKEFLKFDTLIVNINLLRNLTNTFEEIIILTNRTKKENLLWQMEKLGLLRFFKLDNIILVDPGIESKKRWIEQNVEKRNILKIIGDSESDIYTANLKGYPLEIFLVETGLRNPHTLIKKFKITSRIVKDINKALNLILKEVNL